MPHHVAGTLPDGTVVYADYRQPVVRVMRRQLAAAANGTPPDPADAELIAGWAAAHPGDVCARPFAGCAHPAAEAAPYRPPPYRSAP